MRQYPICNLYDSPGALTFPKAPQLVSFRHGFAIIVPLKTSTILRKRPTDAIQPIAPANHLKTLGFPLAMPLPLLPRAVLPREFPPRSTLTELSTLPRRLGPEPGRLMGAGVVNLVGALEDGGLSMKEVSVVMKVSSTKSGRRLWSGCGPWSSSCPLRS